MSLTTSEYGLSQSAVSRIWCAFALQPTRSEVFQLLKDPLCLEKVRDVVGRYLHPPDRAWVLYVDEKTPLHALDRSRPLLPLRPGQAERHTHDDLRPGTTALCAALNVKTGTVLGAWHRRHRRLEFRQCLATIEEAAPPGLDLHLILDNYSTPKPPMIRRWLAKRPRYHATVARFCHRIADSGH